MSNKIKCTCGHSWNKSSSSKKDMNICHICGKDTTMQMGGFVYPVNYVPQKENGGWLDAYDNVPEAQNGIEGTMGGLTDKGFNYNGAWGGPSMQNGGLTFLEPTSRKLPMGHVIPMSNPSTELAISVGGEDGEPAYLIPSFKYGKYLIDKDAKAEFRKTGEHLGGPFKTWQEADEWERTVRHPYVEKGQSIPTPFRRWGKDFAMGGSLPGSVGFTYARTQGIPSEGPYAKKTMPSAQDGIISSLSNAPLNLLNKALGLFGNQPSQTPQVPQKEEVLPTLNVFDKISQKYNEKYRSFYDKWEANNKIDPENKSKNPVVLDTGRFRGAKVEPTMIDDLIKAAESQGVDPWLMVALAGRESTFGSGTLTNQSRSSNKDQIVSGWTVTEDYVPRTIASFLADKKVPGVNTYKHSGGWTYDIARGQIKSVEDYLNNHPEIVQSYYKQLEKTPDIGDLGGYDLAAKRIKEKGLKSYNPGDPNYSKAVIDDMSTLKNDKAMAAYMKSRGFQNGGEMKFYQEGLDWKPRNISQDGTYVKKPRTDMPTMDEYRLQQALKNQPQIKQSNKKIDIEERNRRNKEYAQQHGRRYNESTGSVEPLVSTKTERTMNRAMENIIEPMISLSPVGEIGMVGDLAKGVKKYITAKASKQKLSSFDQDMKEAFRQIEEESSKITKPKAPDPRTASREELKKYFQKLDEDDAFDWSKEPERTFGSMTADRIEAENYLRNFPKETRKQSDQLKQMFDTYHEDVNILKKSPEEADPSGIIRDLKNNPENVWNMYDLMSPEESRKMLPVTLKGGTDYVNQDLTGGGRQLLGDRGEGIFKKKADDFGKYEQVKPWQIFNKEFFMRKNKNGGITKDDNGYWNPENWGEPVEIGSNEITMQGVYEPLLGISDTGDTQMMYPGEDYEFDGESVTEYPVMQNGGRAPLYVSDPNDSRLKNYQDSLYSYNVGQRMRGILDADKNLKPVKPGSPLDVAFHKSVKRAGNKQIDNSQTSSGGYKNYEKVGAIMKEYQGKGNKGIMPERYQTYWPNPDNFAIDLVTLRDFWDAVGVTDPRPGSSHIPQWKKPEQQVVYDPSKTPKPKPVAKSTPKKEQPTKQVEKPQPKQEVVKKQEPTPQPVIQKEQPKPVVEKRQNIYEGSPVYSPGAGSGLGSALIGFLGQQGDTTYIKPEDYERFAVPKYGKEFIESKTKKKKNGGWLEKYN